MDYFANLQGGLRRSSDNPLCVNIRGCDFIVLSYSGGNFSYSQDILSRLDDVIQKKCVRESVKTNLSTGPFPCGKYYDRVFR